MIGVARREIMTNLINLLRYRIPDPANRGTNWIYPGFPRKDATFPRISVTRLPSSITRETVSGNQVVYLVFDFQVDIWVNVRDEFTIGTEKFQGEKLREYLTDRVTGVLHEFRNDLIRTFGVEIRGQSRPLDSEIDLDILREALTIRVWKSESLTQGDFEFVKWWNEIHPIVHDLAYYQNFDSEPLGSIPALWSGGGFNVQNTMSVSPPNSLKGNPGGFDMNFVPLTHLTKTVDLDFVPGNGSPGFEVYIQIKQFNGGIPWLIAQTYLGDIYVLSNGFYVSIGTCSRDTWHHLKFIPTVGSNFAVVQLDTNPPVVINMNVAFDYYQIILMDGGYLSGWSYLDNLIIGAIGTLDVTLTNHPLDPTVGTVQVTGTRNGVPVTFVDGVDFDELNPTTGVIRFRPGYYPDNGTSIHVNYIEKRTVT